MYENPYAPEPGFVGDPHNAQEARQEQTVGAEWRYWRDEINAGLANEDRWRKEAEAAEEEYFGSGEHDVILDPKAKGAAKAHTVHANIDTLKPLIYSQTPEPIVRRRFRDGQRDAVDAVVAEVAQRLAQACIDLCDFDAAMEEVRDDWLIAGRARPRVLYRAEFGEQEALNPLTGAMEMVPVKIDERVEVTGWHWRRMVLSPAERWRDVRWVGFETFMTRKQVEDHPAMGPERADALRYARHGLGKTHRANQVGDTDMAGWEAYGREQTGAQVASTHAQAVVWEIWDRVERKVLWWCPDYTEELVGSMDDPLNLHQFWDGPAPLLASRTGGSMNPRPDVAYYMQHAKEIDVASDKLRKLLNIISVSAVYAGSQSAEFRKLMSGDNSMIAIKDWLAFAEKGGLGRMIEWLPLDPIVNAARALIEMRAQSKAMIYEITGMSDIVRGHGDPNETATAQGIKGRYAGLRLGEKQARFATMVRDTIRLMLEIAVEQFDVERIAEMTAMDLPATDAELEVIKQRAAMLEQVGAMHAQLQQAMQAGDEMGANQVAIAIIQAGGNPSEAPPPPPEPSEIPETSWETVMRLLRDDFSRKYRIHTETDATILTDEAEDREARIQFIATLSGMAAQLATIPGITEDFRLVKELLLFGVRGFRKARHLEHLITSLPDEAPEQPEALELQLAKIKGEIETLIARERNETQIEVARIGGMVDIKEQELENEADMAKIGADMQRHERDQQHSRQMKGADIQARAAEMGAA